jgi:hypothetical protein
MEMKGSGSGRATVLLWREMRSERMREEEEGLRPNRYKGQDVSLVSTLPCLKGTNKDGAFQVLCDVTPVKLDQLRRHCPYALLCT